MKAIDFVPFDRLPPDCPPIEVEGEIYPRRTDYSFLIGALLVASVVTLGILAVGGAMLGGFCS